MKKESSITITNMGFIGALLIVLLHIKPVPEGCIQSAIVDIIYHIWGITATAVPLFFVISGYLLVSHVKEDGWWKIGVNKRVRSLLLPFYLWTIILMVVKTLFWCISNVCGIECVTPSPTPNGIGWMIAECLGVDFFHLTGIVWYLPTLFLYVLVSPTIVFFARRGILCCAVLLALLFIGGTYAHYGLTENVWIDNFLANGIYARGLFYFALGIVIRLNNNNSCLFFTLKPVMIVSGLILIVVNILGQNYLTSEMMKLYNMLLIMIIARKISIPSRVSSLSMPLYLVHITISWSIGFILNALNQYAYFRNFYFWALKFLLIIIISLLSAHYIRKRYSQAYMILFGGR